MKIFSFPLLFILLFLWMPVGEPITEECECNGIPLKGRVKIVENFPDFEVKIVNNFEDIRVKTVTNFPDDCGEWEFVENFPDFTIKFVDNFPDFTIKYVENFPGID